ncbi:MAG: hypothetical protein ABIR66_05440 [Saprospiraceae bacterium]
MDIKRYFIFFIIACGLIACQKSGLEPKDTVQYLVNKINALAALSIPEDYTILKAENMNSKEQDLLVARIAMNKSNIEHLSNQFRDLRKHSSGPGYGKIQVGWEYYFEMKDQQQYKMIIDTFNNQLILSHRILY